MRNALRFCLLFVVLLGSSSLFAQKGRDETLAKSYFENAEYDKAAYLYELLWTNNNQSQQFYAPLLKCYLQQKKLDDAEKLVRKQSKKYSDNFLYQIDLGAVLRLKGDEGAAVCPDFGPLEGTDPAGLCGQDRHGVGRVFRVVVCRAGAGPRGRPRPRPWWFRSSATTACHRPSGTGGRSDRPGGAVPTRPVEGMQPLPAARSR